MPTKQIGAGDLTERVGFAAPQRSSDDGGGVMNGFAEQFTCAAQFTHLRGGETVLAARLAGQHIQVIRVRASSQSRAVTADWRILDKRRGDVFNIRDVSPTVDRAWIDFLVERGVAT